MPCKFIDFVKAPQDKIFLSIRPMFYNIVDPVVIMVYFLGVISRKSRKRTRFC